MEKLKKELGEFEVWALAHGAIIGWGCFVLLGNKSLPDAGPLGTAMALSIGALMIIIAKSYGILVRRYLVAGGEFTFAYDGFALIGSLFSIMFTFLLLYLNSLAFLSTPSHIAFAIWLVLGFVFYMTCKNYRHASKIELDQQFGVKQ